MICRSSLTDELMELLTFLGADGFEEHAVNLARSLRDDNPESFPAELLHLRALGQAGHLEESLQAMEPLRDVHGNRLEILDEAAKLALAKAALSTPLGEALVRAVVTATPDASPAMIGPVHSGRQPTGVAAPASRQGQGAVLP